MESIAYIYGLKSHNSEVRYVGVTSRSLSIRLAEHVYLAQRNPSLPLHNWIKKHIEDNLEIVLLESCDRSIAASRENYWIKILGTYIKDRSRGLNCTLGGEGYEGWTEEQIQVKTAPLAMSKVYKPRTPRTPKPKAVPQPKVSTANPKRERGKYNTGSNNSASKLTQDFADQIRLKYKLGGLTHNDLAKEYNVSKSTIGAILRLEIWIGS